MDKPVSRSKTTKPPTKTDLNFISKVTKASSGNLYWDNTRKTATDGDMAMSTLSPKEKKMKVVDAFQRARHRRNVKDEFSHFCSETSFTALVRIYNASSWARRIGWIVVFVVMLSWLTYQVSS